MNTILDIKITDGVTEPITLEQFKKRWLIDGEDRDTELGFILKTARRKVEKYTGLLMTGATVIVLAELEDKFTLPYGSGSLTTVKRLLGQDLAGANEWETLTATDYQVLGSDKKIFIPHIDGTYEITYTVTARTDEELVHDLGRVAMWFFENKGEQDTAMPLSLMSNAKTLKRLWV